jgi:hypothetical protein
MLVFFFSLAEKTKIIHPKPTMFSDLVFPCEGALYHLRCRKLQRRRRRRRRRRRTKVYSKQ